MKRREFLATSTLATAGVFTLGGRSVFAQSAPAPAAADSGRKIKLGLIGCGVRGTWIANLFKKHGGYEIHALADYFPDRIKYATERAGLHVPPERCFTGLSGYKSLLETKPDAVAIIAVPWFHPQMAADAIAAGIHVYLAKPVAVDVPGSHLVAATGKLATERKLTMLVDFQMRADPLYIEAVRRVHAGEMGAPVFGEGYYHCDAIGRRGRDSNPAESRLRNFALYKALSGDIITEQNIHTIDAMNWCLGDKAPLHAYGTCGRKSRVHSGDTNDYFTLHFQYPNNTGVTFNSRQFNGYGTLPEGIVFRLFGTKGTLETKYGGKVLIRGNTKSNTYAGGSTGDIYTTGAQGNIAEFHRAVLAGDCTNPTVEPSVRTNLITILGRTAAYENRLVTWDELVRDTTRFEYNLEGLKI